MASRLLLFARRRGLPAAVGATRSEATVAGAAATAAEAEPSAAAGSQQSFPGIVEQLTAGIKDPIQQQKLREALVLPEDEVRRASRSVSGPHQGPVCPEYQGCSDITKETAAVVHFLSSDPPNGARSLLPPPAGAAAGTLPATQLQHGLPAAHGPSQGGAVGPQACAPAHRPAGLTHAALRDPARCGGGHHCQQCRAAGTRGAAGGGHCTGVPRRG